MSTRLLAFIAVCAAALVPFAPAAVAGSTSFSMQIDRVAPFALNAPPGTIILRLEIQCPAGDFALVRAHVTQSPTAFGSDATFVSCTGTKQAYGMIISGGFTAGTADADATVTFYDVNDISHGAGDIRTIMIG